MKNGGLAALIKRGGIYYGVQGSNPQEILANIINEADIPASLDRNKLLEAVLERECLMSTSIGEGIALPHPRNPLISETGEQFVRIAFPRDPPDWNSLDGQHIHTVFLIVSASAKLHLHTLSEINYFCRQKEFTELLKKHAPQEELIGMIAEIEKTWI
ncbi:MAG: PTS sugar transporter subunit IIA [Treponema sp.]|nr:PTS sugar transporter subunit IIA [Treponema sp.]